MVRVPRLFGAMAAALVFAAAAPAFAATGHGVPSAGRSLTAGAVASPDIYGALAAKQILGQGGNAIDAAVATGFALAVTYPEAGNLGGGGFMTVYMDGKPYFLDYRETAPGAATAGMYLNASGEPDPALSLVGNLAVGVPGSVAGLAEAHHRFGRLTWKQDLAPAIALARDGFMVTPQLMGILNGARGELGRPPISKPGPRG